MSLANTADQDLAALTGSTLFAYENMIRYDPTILDLISNSLFYVQTVKFIYIIIKSGWSLAGMFMKELVKHGTRGQKLV